MRTLQQLVTRDRLCAFAIFSFTLLVYLFSTVHQIADSRYSMLVSEGLVKHATFTLDSYNLPRYAPETRGYYFSNGPVYQLEVANNHLYHHFPPGSMVLSAPYVAVLNLFGVSAANADGTYNPTGEVKIQASLAALLMAMLATIFFCAARLLLPLTWSIFVALGGALGTQVYSTASRALWSDTWGILLIGIVMLLLLRHEVQTRALNPVPLATMLAWSYFVRPTFSIHIIAITAYILIFERRTFVRYALTGAAWAAGFVGYSWIHFHQILPNYYRASRLLFENFWIALAGNLISPARGLIVYVPVLLFVGFLLAQYWTLVKPKRLFWLAVGILVGQLVIVSGFPHWWGGHSFGPRMMTGTVPWLVLLAILALRAWLNAREEKPAGRFAWRTQTAAGALLLLASMFIHTVGATTHATWLWNTRPQEIDRHPERLWDWRQPQFLAQYLPYPPPREFPPYPNTRVETSTADAEKYLWYGWLQDSTKQTWTDGNSALVFGSSADTDYILRFEMVPFLVPGTVIQQRVNLSLNDQSLTALRLNNAEPQTFEVLLPRALMQNRNVLKIETPDAQSPQKLGVGEDPRPRGVNLRWFELVPAHAK